MNALSFAAEASLQAAIPVSRPGTGIPPAPRPGLAQRGNYDEIAIAVCKTCVRLNPNNLSACELPCYFLVL